MIKALFFDCFGVLVDDIYGGPMRDDLPPKLLKKWWMISDRADMGEISDAERIDEVSRFAIGGRTAIEQKFNTARRNKDLLNYILHLRKRYKIGLLSNASNGIVERFFMPAELVKYFDDVVLSYQVHLIKPDLEIYRLAIDRLGLKPGESVFVDDKMTNVAAAEKVGMQGVLYKNFAQCREELDKILGEE